MSVNYLNEIISIFLQRGVNEISEKDLSTTVETTGKVCSIEQIHHAVQSNGSSLFQLQCNKEGIFLVRIEPKINICRDFLDAKCVPKPGGCNQLHICSSFGRCRRKDCLFPHTLYNEHNHRIIQQLNCQSVDPILLIRLIQLHNRSSHQAFRKTRIIRPSVQKPKETISSSVQPKPGRQVSEQNGHHRRRGRRSRCTTSENIAYSENLIQSPSAPSIQNINCQIDISFPSPSNSASNMTIHTIVTFLRSEGLSTQKYFHQKTNENFHRWTLQLEENDAVNDLLARSAISYKGFPLKFKRTHPAIDSYSFVLKSTINTRRGPISREKFSSYIDILTNHSLYRLTDLSTSFEQILLIECNKIIDFNQLCRIQKSRRQIQGTNVSLKQIYETETLIIESRQASLSFTNVQNMIKSVYENVFIFTILSNQAALIEFIHADALRQWLVNSVVIEQKFDINIKPSIKYVDEDDGNNVSSRSSAAQSIKSEVDDKNSQVTIYIRRPWALVAGHPKFSIEYKNYIRSEIGVEIDIRGTRVQIRSTSDVPPNGPQSSILRNRTKNFMERFVFRSICLQQPEEELTILRAHSSIVAFRGSQRNTYLLAATNSNMEHIMQKLQPKKLVDNKPTDHSPAPAAASATQGTTRPVDQKQTSKHVTPPPLMSIPCTNDKTTRNDEIITKSMALSISTPAGIALCSDKTVEKCLQIYFNQTYNTKINIEFATNNNNSCYIVKIVGRSNSVDETLEELLRLISLLRTKTFKDIKDIGWLKVKDATRVIQNQLNFYNIICVCQQQTSPVSILVHHIDKKHDKLGVDEQIFETLCRNKLILTTCKPVVLGNEWATLKTDILKRGDYGKDICLFDEQHIITLYGLPNVVKHIQQQFESINQKAVEKLNAVLPVVRSESIISQRSTEVTTSKPLTRSIVFDVDEPGFEVLITQDFHRLISIIDSNCSLVKQILRHQIQIPIPSAKIYELNDTTPDVQSQDDASDPSNDSNKASAHSKHNWFSRLFQKDKPEKSQSPKPTSQVPSASASVNTTPNLTIGKSKIIVSTGDLKKQAVDLIVVCSTSKVLCDAIASAAGSQVENIYNQQSSHGVLTFETSGGNLPCKRIIFRPWVCRTNHPQDIKQTIDTFVVSIITYAIQYRLTTIAFPSIGCGQLGHDPKIIAEHMIGETYRQLKNLIQSTLIVSFVLLPGQQNVYDAFADQLKMMTNIDDTPTTVTFDKQMVKITLTGPDDRALTEYQNKIKTLAQSCSSKVHLTDKTDMADWPQTTIQKYYDYCLQKRVIPTLDIDNATLDLIGPKDAVIEAEKYYFQLTTETLRNARIQVISRGFVWSVEISSGKWEQYSSKIIEQIENAYKNKLPSVDIMNEKSERCRLIFSSMEEQYQKRKRRIFRKRIDSSLPNNWDLSGGTFKRIVLSISSKEYKDVLNRFDMTMKNQYSRIIKIERIQNERWYKQYAVHRDDFTQRHKQPDERLLFHGCSSTSADKIVQECFNRAFAGVNGTLYGVGVYFHEHAKYSHNYSKPDSLGERTMFLARVLIGKTCVGNPSMKVPPEGFDTTTDGQHIFVVYHDAGAYGEYLIIYK